MTDRRLAKSLLIVLLNCFVGSLIWAANTLPLTVATHFDAAGVPNGWMSRSTHLVTMSIFGFVFPAFLVGVCWSIRFLPTHLVNIPHRDYWLSADHRDESARYLFAHSLWLACLALGFVCGLNVLIVFANLRDPVQLPFTWGIVTLALFVFGLATWVFFLYRRFRLPK